MYYNKTDAKSCGVCCSEKLLPITDGSFLNPELEEKRLQFFSCATCGCIFHDELNFFAHDYYTASFFDNPLRMASLSKSFDFILKHFPETNAPTALDIGCSRGNLMILLIEAGFNVYGIEKSKDARLEGNNRGLNIFEDRESLDGQQFDLVSAVHLLEHLSNPFEFMTNHLALLKEGSTLFLEVPSIELLSRGRKSTYNDVYPNHIYHFSESSLNALGSRLGCSIVAMEHHDFLHYPSLMALFRKTPQQEHAKERFLKYISLEDAKIQHTCSQIEKKAVEIPHIVIWGCSDEAFQIMKNLDQTLFNKITLVDSDPIKTKKEILGIPVVMPNELEKLDNMLIVVAPTTPKVAASIKGSVMRLVNDKKHEILFNSRDQVG